LPSQTDHKKKKKETEKRICFTGRKKVSPLRWDERIKKRRTQQVNRGRGGIHKTQKRETGVFFWRKEKKKSKKGSIREKSLQSPR